MSWREPSGLAKQVRVVRSDDLVAGLDLIGVSRSAPVVVLVGGAGGMEGRDLEILIEVMRRSVAPVVERHRAVVVDAGTDSGVARLIGRARAAEGAGFPLVGVAAEGTVTWPAATPPSADAADLEPNHTAFLLVPGSDWGDEAPWIAEVANAIAGHRASVTLVIGGGEIVYADMATSLNSRRPIIVLAGTGRTADAIARASTGGGSDPRAAAIAASPLTQVVDVTDAEAIAAALDALLAASPA